MIAANNGHVLAFDNLSGLPSWLSDALCRLATGSSFARRQLFTDEDEILFHATRPVILNGIEDVVCRADLADCAVFLTLGPISDDRRGASAHPRRPVRWRGSRSAETASNSSRKTAAHGRFRPMGNVLRDRILAAGYIHARL